jgi:hypothetical protein
MSRYLSGIFLAAFSFSAHAFDKADAEKLVKTYSETIACDTSDYEAVKVEENKYVVLWNGDVGCSRGSGGATIVPNFTVVASSGSIISDGFFVVPDYKMPDIDLVEVRKFYGKDGEIFIEGITYGKNDRQHSPSKKVSYALRLDYSNFTVTSK